MNTLHIKSCLCAVKENGINSVSYLMAYGDYEWCPFLYDAQDGQGDEFCEWYRDKVGRGKPIPPEIINGDGLYKPDWCKVKSLVVAYEGESGSIAFGESAENVIAFTKADFAKVDLT